MTKDNRDILRLAIPAIVSNVTVPLLGLSDTAVAGHLGAAYYIGAVSVGNMMLNVIFFLFGFLRMGTTGVTAQALGRRDYAGVERALNLTLKVAMISGAAIWIFQKLVLLALCRIISADAVVTGYAVQYFNLCIWGVPAQMGIMVITGWFIGLQNTRVPMIVSIGVNILNIALSVSLVYLFKIGFKGIAIGTLTANWVGFIVALTWAYSHLRNQIRRQPDDVPINGNKSDNQHKVAIPNKQITWKSLFKVNINLFIRSGCIMSVILAVTAVGARMGEVVLAANAVMMQFFMFFSYFMDGFAFSGEALSGRYAGSGDWDGVKRVVRHLISWGAALAVIFLLLYISFGLKLSSLLTNDDAVLDTVKDYKIWFCILPPLTVAAFIYDGIYVGLTRTRQMMICTIIAAAIFFGIVITDSRHPDNNILWLAFVSYLLARGVLLAADFYLMRNKK